LPTRGEIPRGGIVVRAFGSCRRLIAAGLTYCVERPAEAEADGYALEDVERMFLKLA
jgi:hypothetical protein